MVGQAAKLGDTPHLDDVIGVIKVMLDAYHAGTIDELYVMYNEFVNNRCLSCFVIDKLQFINKVTSVI
jgi:F0F1-type ATP synthase gamma subunit